MGNILGEPAVRVDAVAKVTGAAPYAADEVIVGMAHAALTTSTVARGRITEIDVRAAEAVPGVRLVLTHRNLGEEIGEGRFLVPVYGGQFQSSFNPLASDEIRYFGQIVAVTVAESPEIAEYAASLIEIRYAAEPAVIALQDTETAAVIDLVGVEAGDAAKELARADVVLDEEYETSVNHHNPIELFNVTATWTGGALEVRVPSQWVTGERYALSSVLGLSEEDVRVISPYVGGGFGCKGATLWHTVFTAEAARRLGGTVKLFVSRRQMFTIGAFRPQSRHRLRLGATEDGRFTAYDHEVLTQSSRTDVVALPGTDNTARLYAFPAIRTKESTVQTDTNTPGFMRGPLEFPELFALESGIDELAVKLGIDPVELRLRNEPDKEPVNGLPYSSRSLVECYRRGAELFGWSERDPAIGSMRGPAGELVGWGCASASYPVFEGSVCDCRITVDSAGRAVVEVAAQEIGTGTYTTLGQIGAAAIGLEVTAVSVSLGDSDLPRGLATAASSTVATIGSAVHVAGRKIRERILALAAAHLPGDLTIEGGIVRAANGARVSVAELVAAEPGGVLSLESRYTPPNLTPEMVKTTLEESTFNITGPIGPDHVTFSYGANFAEVRIDPITRRVRLGRMVGVFGVGKVINPRVTRSMLMGGMIWAAGHALMEKTILDRGKARFVNTDLAGYHMATSADIGEVIVETVEERDDLVNVLGAKGGVGEMGIVGMPAAIANAVHHATGIRVRRVPILVDDLV
ncbi:xanthine dehydrogenase family protein molybdopterin-binding subunit [Amycolatopsis umgeniensis]|uniref:Xanthine dehydrogenase YagR molybdenum-binding subunit n=1 Tax=Amycolatopsis umgeniensis TaxID=336628 RepID=A0A841BDX2_9PSEU|nr:xanthine dehydrogenase YagR molybdenum-binding subunit [Amycolatopsis umgeniensis]